MNPTDHLDREESLIFHTRTPTLFESSAPASLPPKKRSIDSRLAILKDDADKTPERNYEKEKTGELNDEKITLKLEDDTEKSEHDFFIDEKQPEKAEKVDSDSKHVVNLNDVKKDESRDLEILQREIKVLKSHLSKDERLDAQFAAADRMIKGLSVKTLKITSMDISSAFSILHSEIADKKIEVNLENILLILQMAIDIAKAIKKGVAFKYAAELGLNIVRKLIDKEVKNEELNNLLNHVIDMNAPAVMKNLKKLEGFFKNLLKKCLCCK